MPRQLDLDERLKTVAAYVRPGAVFADVGCDHGRLSVYLMQQCEAAGGFACDIRPQPLEKARKLIQAKGLADKVTPVLTDGLVGMEGKGVTDVVIAGIGGEVLAHVLEEAPFLQEPGVRLILQPQSKENILRRTVYAQGFALVEEKAVQAGKFLYTIMVAEYADEKKEISDLLAYTGLLPKAPEPEARQKLEITANSLWDMARGMRASPKMAEEAAKAEKLAQEIENLLA